jgi:hypothetical protein
MHLSAAVAPYGHRQFFQAICDSVYHGMPPVFVWLNSVYLPIFVTAYFQSDAMENIISFSDR